MLSSKYIGQTLPLELWKIYTELETDIILKYSQIISKESFTAQYLENKILATYNLRRELEGLFTSRQKEIATALKKTFGTAANKALSQDEAIYQSAMKKGLLDDIGNLSDSKAISDLLNTGYSKALKGLNMAHTSAITNTISQLNKAMTRTLSGAFTQETSIKMAVNELAQSGVDTISFESGRSMNLSSYTRMNVQTSVMQTTRDLVGARMEEVGVDLILVSSHAGARPLCYPYQGRVYTLSGEGSKKYPSINTTSYGEPAGLFGINCRHFYTPFIEGMDNNQDKISKSENNAIYDNTQLQRYYEERVRYFKTQSDAFEKAGIDNSRSDDKIKEWQGKLRNLTEKSGLSRQYAREKI